MRSGTVNDKEDGRYEGSRGFRDQGEGVCGTELGSGWKLRRVYSGKVTVCQ